MRKSIILLCALTLLIVSSGAMIVSATPTGEGSLNSGYYVTTNWHGVDVPTGAEVIATAKTTNHDVDKVAFIWITCAAETAWTDLVPVQWDATDHSGKKV